LSGFRERRTPASERERTPSVAIVATCPAILELHGGSVEKFIGDAVMAVFDVPVLHEDEALRALRSMRRRLRRDAGGLHVQARRARE